jgi:copper homeostasis protein
MFSRPGIGSDPATQGEGMTVAVEICVEDVPSAVAAHEGGADRVELCHNLLVGGTTPSAGAIALACRLPVAVHVIIRPREGDFCYLDVEFEAMRHDIGVARSLGASGVVLGLLHSEGTIDRERTAALIEVARPMSTTFHKAFDMTRDPREALETLIDLGVDRVLTSGGRRSAWEGRDRIAEFVQLAGDRIVIMAGGGISAENVHRLIAATRVREVHIGSHATTTYGRRPTFRNPEVRLGRGGASSEDAVVRTDAEKVREIVRSARSFA